ncbi:fluoride efflux transporter FluC [Bacillus salitolerans]|uniref:Fluoride-specific ion channel FluC n=1 Tax=Bacillus salitolerans TaxID=1437434 RepID=A0ABW4LM89_9BACI
MTFISICIGGSIGALLRYWISVNLANRFPSKNLVATYLVNGIGSFLLGVMIGLIEAGKIPSSMITSIISIGFLGALTTFSTFSLECLQLLKDRNIGLFIQYILWTFVSTVMLFLLGSTFLSRVYSLLFH